MKATI